MLIAITFYFIFKNKANVHIFLYFNIFVRKKKKTAAKLKHVSVPNSCQKLTNLIKMNEIKDKIFSGAKGRIVKMSFF